MSTEILTGDTGIRETGTSRHLICDAEFCGLLADDLGITQAQAEEAFLGEPKKQAVKIVAWAEAQEEAIRQERGVRYALRHFSYSRIVRAWAKRNRKGAFRKGGAA